MSDYWGQHIVLNLEGCPLELINDKNNILAWCDTLVKAVDMVKFGSPFCEYFDNADPGYTLSQIILTSNISFHGVNNRRGAFIDLFSCKKFKAADVIRVCRAYFKPEKLVIHEFYRGGADDGVKTWVE